ncbi:hypothetical protein IAQ61_004844 [Plenodomus lingam]|uniref:uncharacterized protein n=1 Tax=Leptosphaeria maculans TaxID=5022 RepID=UPI003317DCB4|nr:hypothetical protein IAQ61_004844 [Plenodomus lingam]
MSSQTQSMPPPLRTNSIASKTSESSGQLSPASTTSPTSPKVASPTENQFFGAITQRLRGRSRSRSRGAVSRKRSKSPMPQAKPNDTRPALESTGRTVSDPWRGRHSNEWLFGGLSVRSTVRDLASKKA